MDDRERGFYITRERYSWDIISERRGAGKVAGRGV